MKTKKDLNYYMSLNYDITLEKFDEESEERFGLTIPDLPGVWGDGKTLDQAMDSLNESKKAWFAVHLNKGIKIPEPISEDGFSGKFVLRLPPKLHMQLSKNSKLLKISLNQYIKSLLENQIQQNQIVKEFKDFKETVMNEFNRISMRLESIESEFSQSAQWQPSTTSRTYIPLTEQNIDAWDKLLTVGGTLPSVNLHNFMLPSSKEEEDK